MSKSIISHTCENNKPFEETLTVDARFAGGAITIEPEAVEWLGDTLVRVDIPGLTSPLVLRTFEARDLALALLNQAAHIDEQATPEAVAA